MKLNLKSILILEFLFSCIVVAGIVLWMTSPNDLAVSYEDRPGSAQAREQLSSEFSTAFRNRDFEQLKKLFYWEGVDAQTQEIVEEAIAADLENELVDVSLLPPDPNGMIEYEREGKRYAPNLPVTGQLKVTYQSPGTKETAWTSYLIGNYQGRFFITIAAPIAAPVVAQIAMPIAAPIAAAEQ